MRDYEKEWNDTVDSIHNLEREIMKLREKKMVLINKKKLIEKEWLND